MDNYRIGISIVLANGVSPVLHTISNHLLGLHTRITDIERGFRSWGGTLKVVSSILGAGILVGIENVIKATKEYQSELIKLERVGGSMSQAVLGGDMQAKAFDISKRVPMKVEDLMKIPGMTYSILRGDMKEVNETWEPLAKFGYVLQSGGHRHGEDVTKDVAAALRAGELAGRITDKEGQVDLKKLDEWLNFVARVTAATHGMVNGQSLLGMAQQAGFTLRNLDDQGMGTMAIQAQAMGGMRSGTAYLSLWQQMAAGTMFGRTAKGLEELGFLKPDEWHSDHGRVILSDEASKRMTGLVSKDPMVFAEQIKKAMEEHGITDNADQLRALMRMLNRQTTQRFMGEIFTNMNQQLAERGILMQGMGSESSFDLLKNKDIATNMEAVSSAWHNLLVAIGGPEGKTSVEFLKSLTGVLNSMTTAVRSLSPETLAMTMKMTAIFGAALIGLATIGTVVAAVTLAPVASLVAAMGAIVISIATQVPWDRLNTGLDHFRTSINELAATAWQRIVDMFDSIRNAISSFIDAVVKVVGKAAWLFGFGNNKIQGMEEEHPLKHRMFNPGIGGPAKAQPVSMSLLIDGRVLAKGESEQQQDVPFYQIPDLRPA